MSTGRIQKGRLGALLTKRFLVKALLAFMIGLFLGALLAVLEDVLL